MLVQRAITGKSHELFLDGCRDLGDLCATAVEELDGEELLSSERMLDQCLGGVQAHFDELIRAEGNLDVPDTPPSSADGDETATSEGDLEGSALFPVVDQPGALFDFGPCVGTAATTSGPVPAGRLH